MQIPDDGLRSSNDWKSRPITAEVHDNLHIANFMGAQEALRVCPGEVAVVNLSLEPMCGADNTHAVEDSKEMTAMEADEFLAAAADKVASLQQKVDWVVVNCRAGVNRSSAVVLACLVKNRGLSLKRAKALLKGQKAVAAKRLRFKNRFQSWTKPDTIDKFSWPTLCGGAAKQLEAALKRIRDK